MSSLQKFAIWVGAFLMLAVGFWAGQDFGRFDVEYERCKSFGGDGMDKNRQCFRREPIALPPISKGHPL